MGQRERLGGTPYTEWSSRFILDTDVVTDTIDVNIYMPYSSTQIGCKTKCGEFACVHYILRLYKLGGTTHWEFLQGLARGGSLPYAL